MYAAGRRPDAGYLPRTTRTPTPGTCSTSPPAATALRQRAVHRRPGWDGPTGLGTPNGVAALPGPHGAISGTVTDAATGDPSPVRPCRRRDGHSATTDATGHYDLTLPVGTYDVTASVFGYADEDRIGVAVDEGQTVTEAFALDQPEPPGVRHGHRRLRRMAGRSTRRSPSTGTRGDVHRPVHRPLHVTLPAGRTTRCTGEPVPGLPADRPGRHRRQHDQTWPCGVVDPTACVAPGYAFGYDGTSFKGWAGTTPQDGWTVTDEIGNGITWRFDNPGNWAPPPGSDHFASSTPTRRRTTGHHLVSPVLDLTGQKDPQIGFDTAYIGSPAARSASSTSASTAAPPGAPSGTTTTDDVVGSRRPRRSRRPPASPRSRCGSVHRRRELVLEIDNVFVGNRYLRREKAAAWWPALSPTRTPVSRSTAPR